MKSYKSFYEALGEPHRRDSLVIKDEGAFDALYDMWWSEVDPYIDALSQPDTHMILKLISSQPDGRPAQPGFRVIGSEIEFDFHIVKIGNWPPSDTFSVQDLEEYEADKLVMLEKVLGETGIPTAFLFKGQRWLLSDVKKWWFKNLQKYKFGRDVEY